MIDFAYRIIITNQREKHNARNGEFNISGKDFQIFQNLHGDSHQRPAKGVSKRTVPIDTGIEGRVFMVTGTNVILFSGASSL